MPSIDITTPRRGEDVERAMAKLDRIWQGFDGGSRVQAVEALRELWEAGRRYGQWEPQPLEDASTYDEPAKVSPTRSEPITRLSVARAALAASESPSEADAWGELRGWWEQTAHDEIAGLLTKMTEYGGMQRATDLVDVGQALIEAGVKMGSTGVDAWRQELGAYFYLVGKFGRWRAAIAEGRPVSDDTLHDIAIYTRMVQRIRAVGGWPV